MKDPLPIKIVKKKVGKKIIWYLIIGVFIFAFGIMKLGIFKDSIQAFLQIDQTYTTK